MNSRFLNILFISVFMLMIIVPPLFSDKNGGDISEEENRVLAQRPHLDNLLETPGEFPVMVENWLADNIKFRRTMIRAYRAINKIETNGQYWVGNHLYLIGENGHHFFAYYDGKMMNKFQGEDILYDFELQALADAINNIDAYLAEKDIPLIVMFATDKETIYPEYYPRSVKRGPEPIPLERVTTYLQVNTSADVFNIREALKAEKNNFLLYNKTVDLEHYNKIGGFFAYQELMRQIQPFIPEIRIMSIDDMVITFDKDGIPDVSLKEGPQYEVLPPEFFDNVPMQRPFMRGTAATQNEDPNLPVLLMMRDSYFTVDFMPALPQSFSQALLIDYLGNMGYFKQYVETYDPDIVVIAVAEREIGTFTRDLMDSGW